MTPFVTGISGFVGKNFLKNVLTLDKRFSKELK
jgi:dTDP-D-glucose 4,6-dehydratase